MILGIVRGTVVSTVRADHLEGATYLLVEQCDQHGSGHGAFHVVLDHLGSAQGEVVLVAQGSPNRQTDRTKDKPIDASIVGIVDLVCEAETTTYKK